MSNYKLGVLVDQIFAHIPIIERLNLLSVPLPNHKTVNVQVGVIDDVRVVFAFRDAPEFCEDQLNTLKILGCENVLLLSSVGSLRSHVKIGELVIITGFGTTALNPYSPSITLHYPKASPTVNVEFSKILRATINTIGVSHHDSSVLIQNNLLGRYETELEAHELAKVAHVVGRFTADEICYLNDKGINCAALGICVNVSTGAEHSPHFTESELKHSQRINSLRIEHAIQTLIMTVSRKPLQRTAVDLVLHGKYVLPMTPDCPVLLDHSVIINDEKIVEIIPSDLVYTKYAPREAKYYGNHAILPGFINCHTHLPMNILRGYGDDMPLHEWLNNKIWPAEGKFIDEEFISDGMKLGISELIRSGVTCFNDMYFYIPTQVSVGKEMGIRGVYGFSVMSFPSKDATDCADALLKAEAFITEQPESSLVHFSVAPHAPYTVKPTDYTDCVNFAKKHHITVHTHIQETPKEVEDYKKEHKCSPIEKFNELGLLGPHFISVHSVSLSPKDIEILGKTKCSVVHNPSSNAKLASGICPVSALVEHGVNVALGTDSSASNNSLSMFNEMKLAALFGKLDTLDAVKIPAKQVLLMATINGAKAIGLADKIGSLENGKFADITVLDIDTVEMIPLFDVASQIVYCGQRDIVRDVYVGGKQLLKDGELLTINKYELFDISEKWVKKLKDFEVSLKK